VSAPFLDFFFSLRRAGLKVGTSEWLALQRALELGLHDTSLTGFYHTARAILVKSEADFDRFDLVFSATFRGLTGISLNLTDELKQWLSDPRKLRLLSDEELRLLKELDPDALRKLFEERLKEQRERHDGGNRWIGTGGTSPFGRNGQNPSGMRLDSDGEGEQEERGGGRTAMKLAEERRFRDYRDDRTLDVRQLQVALRLLRELTREGVPDELDLDGTIDKTCKNAGELEILMRPERRSNLRVVLAMDVGGSMWPYAELVERLFSAASKASHFKKLTPLYFHNCVYENLYRDARFLQPVPVAELLLREPRTTKLIVVGDAQMAYSELMSPHGSIYYRQETDRPGLEWLRLLSEHFRRSVWLNPTPETEWNHPTARPIAALIPMFRLSLHGLGRAVRSLTRDRLRA
jgi:uncharacterized protein with von Willebrand factor type A (vWA) domain